MNKTCANQHQGYQHNVQRFRRYQDKCTFKVTLKLIDVSCVTSFAKNYKWTPWSLKIFRAQISVFHFITPKGTSLCDFASFEPLSVKTQQGVSSLRWSEKKINKKSHTKKIYFTPLPRSPRWTDFYQMWNKHSSRGRNQSWQIVCQSVQGFRFYRGQSFHFPIGNWRRRYNSAALPRSLWQNFRLCIII